MFNLLKEEYTKLNPIRRKINYIVVPAYLLLMIVCLTTICIFMGIDDVKYLPLFIILMGIFALVSIGLLAALPFIRKKETAVEMEKYDFDSSSVEKKNCYTLITENNEEVTFNEQGVKLGCKLFPYEKCLIEVNTFNYLNQVHIVICFEIDDDLFISFSIDKHILQIINQFNIKVVNRELLDYITSNKFDAFYQILKYSKIKNINK